MHDLTDYLKSERDLFEYYDNKKYWDDMDDRYEYAAPIDGAIKIVAALKYHKDLTPKNSFIFSKEKIVKNKKARKSVEKYFGLLYAEKFEYTPFDHQESNENEEYYFYAENVGENDTRQKFLDELDNIPATEFFKNKFTEDFYGTQFELVDGIIRTYDCTFAFIEDGPYRLYFKNEYERRFFEIFIMLLRENHESKKPQEKIEVKNSADEYAAAIHFVAFNNGLHFNYSDQEIKEGRALVEGLYLAKFVFDALSVSEIEDFLNDFFDLKNYKENKGHFFDKLNENLSEKTGNEINLATIFKEQTIETVKDVDMEKIDDYFRYPKLIKFSKNAENKINQAIFDGKLRGYDFLRKYFQVFSNKTAIYPAIKKILKETEDADEFWVAGDFLNEIWVNTEDKAADKWLNKEIKEIFMPRIEDEKNEDIRKDAFTWLESVNNCRKPSEFVPYRPTQKNAEKIIKNVLSENLMYNEFMKWYNHLGYAMSHGNREGVGVYMIQQLTENIDKFYTQFEKHFHNKPENELVEIFLATCDGLTTETEFEALKDYKKALIKKLVSIDYGYSYGEVKEELIPSAMKAAERNKKDYAEISQFIAENYKNW